MRRTATYISAVITVLLFPLAYCNAQCLGPKTTGTYTNGYQPTANGNYFSNHVFSSFSSATSGSLNGNTITVSTTTSSSASVTTTAPDETLVSGTSLPSNPSQIAVSTATSGIKTTFTFNSALPAGTHFYLQDVDRQEVWTVVFKTLSGTVINPSSFTPFNVSTTNLPSLTTSASSLSFQSSVKQDKSEPLVGVIIPSGVSVQIVEVTLSTAAFSANQTGFYFSVPITPNFTVTAGSNSPVCSGSSLNLTATPSSLASTVPVPLSYTWSGPNTFTSSSQNPVISSATVAASGTYTLKATDAFGCYTTTQATTSVTVNASPVVSLSNNSPVSYGSTINLNASVSSGTSPYTFAWTGPNSFTSSSQNPSISSATSAKAGVYKLSVTGANNCTTKASIYTAVNSGYLYIHKKTINEESSFDFSFNVKDAGGTVVKSFVLNDLPSTVLDVYDIGAGHEGGNGELWAVAGSVRGTNNTGTVYRRKQGSTVWESTGISAKAVDGAGVNQFFYIDGSGDGYFYNAGSTVKIFDHNTSHNTQTALASDIAYGGGQVAVCNANGRVYLYTGDFTNDSWNDISNNTSIAERIDISSTGSSLIYIKGAVVNSYNISTGITTTQPVFTTTSGAGQAGTRDIAVDDNGTIYATGNTGNTTCCGNIDVVFSLPANGSAWTSEPEARGVVRLTGGAGGQAWGSINIGSGFSQTIYTRATDNAGTHLWIDDERVRSSSTANDNAVMIEVAPGSYDVTETFSNSNWDLGRYNLYDPTGNTTADALTRTATINVAAGEAVHVEYINEKLIPKQVDNSNCNTTILQSFDTTQFGNGTFGTALEGTSYHYYTATSPQDGYYYLMKSINGYWFSSPGITDHSGNNGYFLMVNASYGKDEFYRQRITGLAGNLTYRIEFYVANVSQTSPIKPKIRFGMQTLNGVIFGDSTTSEVAGGWQRFSVSFTVPSGVTTADLFLRNENIGGLGNDLTIDDIALNPIPTPLTSNQISSTSSNLCIGQSYTISNSVKGGTWTSSDTSRATIDTAGKVTTKSTGPVTFTYTYVNNIFCVSTASSDITLNVPPSVQVSTTSISPSVCKGDTLTLHSTSTSGTPPYNYSWTGNGGTLSSTTIPEPLLTTSLIDGMYNYKLIVTDSYGCSASATTSVTVHAPSAAIQPVCYSNAGTPYAQLIETGGTQNASWFWTTATDGNYFYTDPTFSTRSKTSRLQSPIINYGGSYKVVVNDPYGCKDSASIFYDRFSCVILPIKLLDFTVTKSNETVKLAWATSFELNNETFIVERSKDGINWIEAGRLESRGNQLTKSYSFEDSQPFNGVNYYRLKHISSTGDIFFSPVKAVKIIKSSELTLFPNPVIHELHFKTSASLKYVQIKDVNGRTVIRKTSLPVTELYTFDISSLAAGIYMIEVCSTSDEVTRSYFIKK